MQSAVVQTNESDSRMLREDNNVNIKRAREKEQKRKEKLEGTSGSLRVEVAHAARSASHNLGMRRISNLCTTMCATACKMAQCCYRLLPERVRRAQ